MGIHLNAHTVQSRQIHKHVYTTPILHGCSTKQEFRSGCLKSAAFSEGVWIQAAVRWLPQMRHSHYVGWWSGQSGASFAPSARRSIAATSASPSVHRVHLRSPPMPMFPVSELTARMANGPVAVAAIVQNVTLTDRFRVYKKHFCPPLGALSPCCTSIQVPKRVSLASLAGCGEAWYSTAITDSTTLHLGRETRTTALFLPQRKPILSIPVNIWKNTLIGEADIEVNSYYPTIESHLCAID